MSCGDVEFAGVGFVDRSGTFELNSLENILLKNPIGYLPKQLFSGTMREYIPHYPALSH
jgi:hypothetical protein